MFILDPHSPLDGLKHYYVTVKEEERFDTLVKILHSFPFKQCVIYVSSREAFTKLTQDLPQFHYRVSGFSEIGPRPPYFRMIYGFCGGRTDILVTAIVSSAINIETVSLVINYEACHPQSYPLRVRCAVHMGKVGVAISKFTDRDAKILKTIRKAYSLKIHKLPDKFTQTVAC